MKNFLLSKRIITQTSLFVGVILLVWGVQLSHATWSDGWNAPTEDPTGANANKPLHTGTADQLKYEGDLGLNALSVYGDHTIDGGLSIGTASTTYAVELGGIAGTDGIRFPDGTVATTAPNNVYKTKGGMAVNSVLNVGSDWSVVIVNASGRFGSRPNGFAGGGAVGKLEDGTWVASFSLDDANQHIDFVVTESWQCPGGANVESDVCARRTGDDLELRGGSQTAVTYMAF